MLALLLVWAAAWTAVTAAPLRRWALRYAVSRPQGERVRRRALSPMSAVVAVGAMTALTVALSTSAGSPWAGAAAVPVLAVLTLAALTDVAAHLLPNRLLEAATAWLLVCGAGATLAIPRTAHLAVVSLVCGAATGVLAGFAAAAPRGTGLGMGDVKMLAVLALWLGWFGPTVVWTGIVLGFLVAGLTALALVLVRRAGRRDPIALGPSLLAGAVLAWAAALTP